MSIEEMRLKKKATEQAIRDLLNDFAEEAGMAIASVDVDVIDLTTVDDLERPDRKTIIGHVRVFVE